MDLVAETFQPQPQLGFEHTNFRLVYSMACSNQVTTTY
ncbi:hypothetical protein GYH30_003826 [Glycine max]|nr:hypothetical protein GYH30_003826 [Glycine max]KHN29918.1 hypothetical protein glysoja_014736 [Glycine soja]